MVKIFGVLIKAKRQSLIQVVTLPLQSLRREVHV